MILHFSQNAEKSTATAVLFFIFSKTCNVFRPLCYYIVESKKGGKIMKKSLLFVLAAIIALSLCACGETPPKEPVSEIPQEEPVSKSEFSEESVPAEENEPVSEPESTVEPEPEPEKKPVPEGYPENYMTFDEINAEGYYPLWMKPFTEIVYDENKVPSITEGGELTDQYILGREDLKDSAFIDRSVTFRVRPNTKVEYDLWGSIVNIYFKWPDGSYNLSPYSKTENAEITYYEDIDEYEHDKGKTVKMDDYKSHGVFWLADELSFAPESTSKPMDFPRYKITFTYVGTEHCIYIDENNVFTSTMLDGGNYISTLGEDHFSTAAELFGE